MEISELLIYSNNNDASDIHISSKHPPMFRINGEIITLKIDPLSPEQVKTIIYSIMTEKQRSEYEEHLEIDFAINFADKRFRVNAFNTFNGAAAVLRNIPTTLKNLQQLNAPKILENLSELHKGLVLVTGPTGSGKSTTLAAMVNYINKNFYRHIITIEDPIEFVHKSEKSLINQREVYVHTSSFAKALKSTLREDPNIILVGELRDLETIKLALTAAETGHLVLGTLHTSSAAQTVDRIIDVFPSEEKEMVRTMLSNSIEGIISQKLIKKADGSGRVAAYEVLIANSAIRNLIKEGKIAQITSLMQINSQSGMKIMKDSIFELVDKGVITADSAKSALNTTEQDKGQLTKGF
ncbi:MAG: type IV pilus twitching motility protein PilT [Alphaproteobacteria bacterium]